MFKFRRMSVINRIGERHGRLVVVSRSENKIEPSGAIRAQWFCQCDCGNTVITSGQSLSRGSTKSCGCITKEMRKAEAKHGMYRTSEFRIWNTMLQRCTNQNNTAYKSYGGRGITVCDRWRKFENFFSDMGPRPEGMTLEREDNNKGYEPGNCKWATRLAQANNRRTNVLITFDGETKTASEWGRITGLGKEAVLRRIGSGWSVKKALTEPLQDTGRRRRKAMK